MNMKILGYEHVSFSFQDGKCVNGYYVYLQDEAAPQTVVGIKTERVFLSDPKARDCGFSPKVGDKVRLVYNRYGKVDAIDKVTS